MAVFKHAYKGYDGPLTPAWSRFLILPRYAFESIVSNITNLILTPTAYSQI